MQLPIIGDTFSFDVQLLALDDMTGIGAAVIISNASVDLTWKEITAYKSDLVDEITKGSVYSFDEKLSVTAMDYKTTDVDDFYLVLITSLRDGETLTEHAEELDVIVKIDYSFKANTSFLRVYDTIAAGTDGTKYTYINDDTVHEFLF